jgi:glutathione peroxidase
MQYLLLAMISAAAPASGVLERGAAVLGHVVKDIDGNEVDLAKYKGKVVMIVNVASKCGFTPQYEQLEAVYKKYADQGFVVLGFPSNDFMWQEPGSDAEIKRFCHLKYNVTFDMFAKVSVRGSDQAPIYGDLTSKKTNGPFGGMIKWNFTKFIVGRDGRVCARFAPTTRPDDRSVVEAIERELAAEAP